MTLYNHRLMARNGTPVSLIFAHEVGADFAFFSILDHRTDTWERLIQENPFFRYFRKTGYTRPEGILLLLGGLSIMILTAINLNHKLFGNWIMLLAMIIFILIKPALNWLRAKSLLHILDLLEGSFKDEQAALSR